MPNYKTHLSGGLISYLIVLYVMSNLNPTLITSLQWLTCCLIGSLFPDIDTKSKIQKIFYLFILIVFITLTINNQTKILITLSFIGLLPLIVNHRGIFHNIWFILFVGFSIMFLGSIYNPNQLTFILCNVIFFITGVISHLYLDMGLKKMLKI